MYAVVLLTPKDRVGVVARFNDLGEARKFAAFWQRLYGVRRVICD